MKPASTKTAASASATAPAAPVFSRLRKPGKKPSPKSAEASGKVGKLVTLLKRAKGTTIAEMTKATDWKAHSVRGAISGTIKKRLKLAVVSEKTGDVRIYRIKG